jgi:ABC-type multidrug transport system fused ATPase/permease subunit
MAAKLFDCQIGKAEMDNSQLVRPSFYGYGALEVSKRPGYSTAFAALSCLQSFGHAGLALAGAACAQAMLGGSPRIPAVLSFDSSSLVIGLATFGFVSACVKAAGGAGAGYFQARLSGAFGDALRLDVLRRRDLSLAQARQEDQGGASATFTAVDDLTTGVREAQAGFAAVLGAFKAVLQIVPLAFLAAWSGTRMAGVAVLVLVPFAIALGRAKKRVKLAQTRALDGSASLLEAADEAIRHAELWHSYGAGQRVADRVRRAGEAVTRRAARAAAVTSALSGATEALGALALLLAVVAFGNVTDGGRLLTFAVAFFMAYKPVRELAEARIAWTRASAAMERITQSETETESESETETETESGSESVELRGVRLARGKLGAIDERIEAGTIVCVCGPTGIGKTTLLRTLLGFAKPKEGEVLFSGKPFAWVPQDAPIVRGTLAENVALGGDADVKAAMRAIGAGDLFERLGDAQLGVGGRALSGGEQKQVAIARALATKKPILLLDEPTSGLDDTAQALVLSAIEKLRGTRTVIIVTHRPEPRAIADRVITFEPPTEQPETGLRAP